MSFFSCFFFFSRVDGSVAAWRDREEQLMCGHEESPIVVQLENYIIG